ncbi:MAG: DoxX family membrane protein [Lewinella sp.]|nr:DoxX family membrane protein [Lewinella sp.]
MDLFAPYRNRLIFRWLYWTARIGLGLTFIASGIRKLPGVHFTLLPESDPVGAYFAAMEATGFYWHFIGYFQILVGLLTCFNRTVITALVLMMPVTVNIFLISVTLHMRGTPIITGLMLLGNLYLLFWHYPNYRTLLQRPIR